VYEDKEAKASEGDSPKMSDNTLYSVLSARSNICRHQKGIKNLKPFTNFAKVLAAIVVGSFSAVTI
jgi:hypothetical protein